MHARPMKVASVASLGTKHTAGMFTGTPNCYNSSHAKSLSSIVPTSPPLPHTHSLTYFTHPHILIPAHPRPTIHMSVSVYTLCFTGAAITSAPSPAWPFWVVMRRRAVISTHRNTGSCADRCDWRGDSKVFSTPMFFCVTVLLIYVLLCLL